MGVLACASLAIAGFPFTSGFFSKDAILGAAYEHAPWMFWVGVVTAGMTAFYVFRSIFMCFFGTYRGHHHPHESPVVMWAPLAVLAVLSLGGGWYFKVPHYLEPVLGAPLEGHDEMLVYISVAAGLIGIALAYFFYVVNLSIPESLGKGRVYQALVNKYWVDEAYWGSIIHPIANFSRNILWKIVDAGAIDGTVNGAGHGALGLGGLLRTLQSGNIRSYAAWVLVGAVMLVGMMAMAGGNR